jgi:hypothetical protein
MKRSTFVVMTASLGATLAVLAALAVQGTAQQKPTGEWPNITGGDAATP